MSFAKFLQTCHDDGLALIHKFKLVETKVVTDVIAAKPAVDGLIDEVDVALTILDPPAAAYGRAARATFDALAEFLVRNGTKNSDGSVTLTIHQGIVADGEKAVQGAADWWKQAGIPVPPALAAPAP